MSFTSRLASSSIRSLRVASPSIRRTIATVTTTARPVFNVSPSSGSAAVSFVNTSRCYSTHSDHKPSPEEILASQDPDSPIAKIMNNPAVLQALMDLNEYLLEKKYITDGQAPGMLMVVKMLRDSTFKEKLLKVKQTMDEEGIKLTEADLMKFAQTMGFNFKK